jgi:hypothetical protein
MQYNGPLQATYGVSKLGLYVCCLNFDAIWAGWGSKVLRRAIFDQSFCGCGSYVTLGKTAGGSAVSLLQHIAVAGLISGVGRQR